MPMNAYQPAVPSDLSGSLVPFRFGTLAACHSAPLRKACSFIGIPSRGMIPYSGRETALPEKWIAPVQFGPVSGPAGHLFGIATYRPLAGWKEPALVIKSRDRKKLSILSGGDVKDLVCAFVVAGDTGADGKVSAPVDEK